MSKKKTSRGGIVFSTDPNYSSGWDEEVKAESLPASRQNLRLHLDRLKGNKVATRITGFVGNEEDLKDLGKTLKSQCGVGGTAKDNIILLQGDVRTKVEAYLNKEGYRNKRSGG